MNSLGRIFLKSRKDGRMDERMDFFLCGMQKELTFLNKCIKSTSNRYAKRLTKIEGIIISILDSDLV